MVIETSRLHIRPPQAEDAADLFDILMDPIVFANNCIPPVTRDQIAPWIEKMRQNQTHHVIVLKSDQHVIGEINIEHDSLRYGVDCVMFSYNMHPHYRGFGYMEETLRAIIHQCFLERPLALVSARVFADNHPSQKLLLKLGFQLEGTIRYAVKSSDGKIHDDCTFSLLRSEWQVD